jgi:hypothetical protein
MKNLIRKIIKEELITEIGDYDMNMIKTHGGKVLDSVNINGYELALVDFFQGKSVSLTYNDRGYSKPYQQQKQPSEYKGSDMLKIYRQFKLKVMDWAKKYGLMYVGSTNKSRVQKYHNWLCSDLKCSEISKQNDMPNGESQYVFTLS